MMSEETIIYANARFKVRSGTKAEWDANKEVVLESGEPGVVTDGSETEKIKFGDGKTSWENLGWWKGPKGDKGDPGAGAVADQTYDSKSSNAQSGKAVAQAVASKMDTFGTVTTEPYVKSVTITDENGDITDFHFVIPSYMTGWFKAGQLILQGQDGGLILRSDTRCIDCEDSRLINISDPINANDAANKQYVDGLVGDISAALDELHTYAQALINGGGA